MGCPEGLGCGLHPRLPAWNRLEGERGKTVIAAGQIGQERVDSGAIEAPHHLEREAPQLVGLVKPRRADEHARGALAIEGYQQFLAGSAVSQRDGPRGDHARGGLAGGKLGLGEG